MALVTVILSSLNHAKYLAAAIESVLNQTFADFELFIVDDASDDGSWEIIQEFKDPRIVAIRNPRRMRAAFGFNEVIKNRASGEFIAIHHSDDVWALDKLEKQLAFLDSRPEVGAVFSQAEIIGEDGFPFADAEHFYYSIFRQKNRSRFEWLRYFFFSGNCLCHPSMLARRTVLIDAGLYDRRLGQLTDFDMWIRVCMRYPIHVFDTPLVKFRVRAGEANESGFRLESIVRGKNEWLHVLRNYVTIQSERDLHAVFPEIRDSFPPGSPPHYQLARHALEAGGDVQRVFGLEVLYTLMANERTAAELEQHGFRYVDLVTLSGQCDFFQNSDRFRAESNCLALKAELHRVKNTYSWRSTKPFRGAWSIVRKLFPSGTLNS